MKTIATDGIFEVSMRRAALIAGIIVFIPTAPYAELFVMQKLIVHGSMAETVGNIQANKSLFVSGILSYLFTFMYDILLAWALYIFLAPVSRTISLLAGWFRVLYTAVALASLLPLINIWGMVDATGLFGQGELYGQVNLALNAHYYAKNLAFIIFGIYLGVVGFLVFRSNYIPGILGILLVVAGAGYVIHSLQPFLFPGYNVDFLFITFFGELIFTLWLLIKGTRIRELTPHCHLDAIAK